AVDAIAEHLRKGGRLIYVGAGTSGRLGVIDASECPPTFSSDPRQVIGLIAGGPGAFLRAVEGAEDDPALAADDLQQLDLTHKDVVVGIASSGRTPYVLGAIRFAASQNALTVAVTCNPRSKLAEIATLTIAIDTGPEVVTGSTRLKAGTATKMVLNMLSTGAFVRLNKTYGNLMVDLMATNDKLRARSLNIVVSATGCDRETAERVLGECDGEVKTALVALRKGVDAAQARTMVFHCGGSVRDALES
ncbi:MAG: N-acetylmuramic acid 6-phosphate etherase, partial [Planctomycetes bacterium]|nr:N-acetylmuramic acid 6-phosphate etherase [Planctomycetota bacterium]